MTESADEFADEFKPFVDVLEPALVCIECGRSGTPGERGWRVYHDTNDGPFTYCPGCAQPEFDDDPDGYDDSPDD